jgi:hypothetical protein
MNTLTKQQMLTVYRAVCDACAEAPESLLEYRDGGDMATLTRKGAARRDDYKIVPTVGSFAAEGRITEDYGDFITVEAKLFAVAPGRVTSTPTVLAYLNLNTDGTADVTYCAPIAPAFFDILDTVLVKVSE